MLMDLDVITKRTPFPNLALMKLSTFHKAKGDEIFLNFPLCQPDITYASCIFTWHCKQVIGLPENVIIGGSGVDLKKTLPPEVEHIMPDYSLYPKVDFSLGFTSRGCPRKCPWCIVPRKEGGIVPWASIYEFWEKRHQKIVLMDNNLLAAPNWRETMTDLIKERVEVDFNQGLDIRLVSNEVVYYLSKVKTKVLRFAFDHLAYERAVRDGIGLLLAAGISPRKLFFYVLVGFNGAETAVERVEILKSYNVDIYPMIYKDNEGKEPKLQPTTLSLAGYHGSWNNLRKFQRVITKQKRKGVSHEGNRNFR